MALTASKTRSSELPHNPFPSMHTSHNTGSRCRLSVPIPFPSPPILSRPPPFPQSHTRPPQLPGPSLSLITNPPPSPPHPPHLFSPLVFPATPKSPESTQIC
ncbi:hypothetical protein M011DRAFT_287274 [Sporormia fimetaria CBS 119925]|uniref:Uncharacterized protein n=1 Tax=Sporormia fimetaria CBS 119925 TaxID=1340428 RepID=A0A6A6VHE7_9PLEO|nr:hypothetical protein M011DRAFT_287274 [Sporormia fimetaria CBS 119925]